MNVYHPTQFYLIILSSTLALSPITAYLSSHDQLEAMPLLLITYLFLPAITAMTMIYRSGSQKMIRDFWTRLVLFRIRPKYLAVIIFLMPSIIFFATILSLPFGYSSDQFFLAKELSLLKGWNILGIFIPLLFAPLVEELAWRGYGVDSLRAHFNLFTSSAIFGALWSLWHLPLLFIKGAYQNQLWDLGIIYVLNFFVSIFVLAFLLNWVYYKMNRSIPAMVIFHAVINLSSMLLSTEPFTKCLVTILLGLVIILILVQERAFFFDNATFRTI